MHAYLVATPHQRPTVVSSESYLSLQPLAPMAPPNGTAPGSGALTSEDRIVRVRAIRACISCRSRKIRCDQVRPTCGSCTRGNILCEYPSQARRPPRPRQPDAVLVQRLARLESVIEQLSAEKIDPQHQQHEFEESSISPTVSSLEEGLSPTLKPPSGLKEIETGLGKLLVSNGKSRYIRPNFWASLWEETADLSSFLYQDEDIPEPDYDPAPGLSFFGRTSSQDLSAFHLNVELSQQLYSIYVSSVDPLIRILHKPTFGQQLALFHCQGPGSTLGLNKGFEALVFAIYYAAITTLQQDQVMALFGAGKNAMLQRYQIAVEQALANARFLQNEELMPMQAFVLFNACIRNEKDTRTSFALTGLVVRIAQSLGLHRDGSNYKMKPFETEMRRRLWYEVLILDYRTSEDHGCDSGIMGSTYDTQLPLNINDDDLSEDPNAPPPVERKEFTEMTFALVRYSSLDTFGCMLRSEPGAFKYPKVEPMTVQQKLEKIESTKKMIFDNYLKGIDPEQPIQKVAYTVWVLMVGKMMLSLYHPLRHYKDGELLPHEMKEKLFISAIELLEHSFSFAADSQNRGYNRWNWFFQKHGHPQALAVALLELNERPVFDTDGLYERGWAAVNNYFNNDLWQMGTPVLNEKLCIWKPLVRLRDKAWKRRNKELGIVEACDGENSTNSQGGQELAVDSGLLVMEDSPIDWTEWDYMFSGYVRMDFE